MGVRFDQDGGISGIFSRLRSQVLGPQLGDVVKPDQGQPLRAPPRGRLWHSPSWAPGLFQLQDLVQHPLLEAGDVFGIHPEDPVPLPPSGTKLVRVHNPVAPDGATTAEVYKVVLPPEAAMSMALPEPDLPSLQTHSIYDQPRAPGKRWQIFGVDGRNLQNVVGAMVAA